MKTERMTEQELVEATKAIMRCLNVHRRCVRLGPGNTFKPEGELKMSLEEFLEWVKDGPRDRHYLAPHVWAAPNET